MNKKLCILLSVSMVMLVGCISGADVDNNQVDAETELESVAENELNIDEIWSEEPTTVINSEGEFITNVDEDNSDTEEDENIRQEVSEMVWDCRDKPDYYGDDPWKEAVLSDGRYAYLVPIRCEKDAGYVIYVELIYEPEGELDMSWNNDVYLTSLKRGAAAYNAIIQPFYKKGNCIYFEVMLYEPEYPDYTFVGTCWDKVNNFSANVYTPEEWELYMDVYPRR